MRDSAALAFALFVVAGYGVGRAGADAPVATSVYATSNSALLLPTFLGFSSTG
jgi:hypothetical protein